MKVNDDDLESRELVTIDVGTLAVIVIIVVTTCFLLVMIGLWCWYRWSRRSSIRCDRCHQVLGYHGVRLPSHHHLPQYNVLVQPQPQQVYQQQQQLHQSQRSQLHPQHHHAGAGSMMGLPGSRQHYLRNQRQGVVKQQYQNVPAIVVDHPHESVECGDSATFQRLGMRDEREVSQSQVSQEARALETRSLSSVQHSPPDHDNHQMELLTPSPVSSANQIQGAVGGVPLDHVTPRRKLGQVRIIENPVHRTPGTRTPGQALKGKMSSLKKTGAKTVTMVEPVIVHGRHDPDEHYQILEGSELCQTSVTTGDLNNLIDDETVETSMILSRDNYSSSSTNDTKTITPGSCVASPQIPPTQVRRKSLLTTQDVYKLYHHYYPNTDDNSSRAASKDSLNAAARKCYPRNTVLDNAEAASPQLIAPGQDVFVTNRGEELSPAAVMETHCNKIQSRRSVSSPQIIITNHDQFVTERGTGGVRDKSQEQSFGFETSVSNKTQHHESQHPHTSPNNFFQFHKNQDDPSPGVCKNPSLESSWSSNCPIARYQQQRGSSASVTPSKIPIKQTYRLEKTPTNKHVENDVPSSSGKKSASKIPKSDSYQPMLPPKPQPRISKSPKEATLKEKGNKRNLVDSLTMIHKSNVKS